ncbi:hypothetical protein [Campylobacter jejuni]|uniref:hypothetical protein n=1 Tax=Campylobacter jejuni TaxID=197 RepID=UPI000F7FE2C3|nr:hypothetical protein [Campylobacter jejuni]RTH72555.1 hypothetical protein C3I43_08575 [Campylobacter jejuni]
MKILVLTVMIAINANALVSERQYNYLSYLALILKLTDTCMVFNLDKWHNFEVYKHLPVKIKTNGSYVYEDNLYNLINICKEGLK